MKAPERELEKKNVNAVVARLSGTFVREVPGDLFEGANKAKRQGVPRTRPRRAVDAEAHYFQEPWHGLPSLVVEGMGGTGKSATLRRLANKNKGLIYVACKGGSAGKESAADA
mmetsp:Transcript_22766/g.73220  ORF Transcript_22766/g.73220 Transcript_22766/m.73220 type:complete len:113 (+) Transcript_22766:744-1082(+)